MQQFFQYSIKVLEAPRHGDRLSDNKSAHNCHPEEKTAGAGICAGKKLKNRFHSMTDQKSADGVTGVLMGKALPA